MSSRLRVRAIGWLVVLLVLLSLSAGPAWAHTVAVGQSKIGQDGDLVRYELAIDYDELIKRLEPDRLPTELPDDTTDGERLVALRGSEQQLATYVGQRVRVVRGGVECGNTLEGLDVVRHQAEVYAVMTLAYQCPRPHSVVPAAFEVQYDLFFDAVSIADRAAHSNIVDYQLGGATGRFVFQPGDQRLVAGGTSLFSSAGRFLILGFEHLMGGIDHVLFLLVIMLGSTRIRGVLRAATAFTAAHSVTLALAATGWVSVPPGIVEPLIALSIAYLAVETMIRGEPRHRLFVIFGFGLIHGLGFAETLTFTDQMSWRALSSLFAFNVGIEVGQALVVLVGWPVLVLARRLPWSRPAHLGASAVIATFGCLWLFQRLFEI